MGCDDDNGYSPYTNPTHPVGSIVIIEEPTHNPWDYTHNERKDTLTSSPPRGTIARESVLAMVYESYMHKGHKMYSVLFEQGADCLDMKQFKCSTNTLSKDICCQHLDEHRITACTECRSTRSEATRDSVA